MVYIKHTHRPPLPCMMSFIRPDSSDMLGSVQEEMSPLPAITESKLVFSPEKKKQPMNISVGDNQIHAIQVGTYYKKKIEISVHLTQHLR